MMTDDDEFFSQTVDFEFLSVVDANPRWISSPVPELLEVQFKFEC